MGKTHFAKRLAKAMATECELISMNALSAGFVITGSSAIRADRAADLCRVGGGAEAFQVCGGANKVLRISRGDTRASLSGMGWAMRRPMGAMR